MGEPEHLAALARGNKRVNHAHENFKLSRYLEVSDVLTGAQRNMLEFQLSQLEVPLMMRWRPDN